MKEFRVKLRLKHLKNQYPYQGPIGTDYSHIHQAPVYPLVGAPNRCQRCGMEFNGGSMQYCCPHGQWCGIPAQGSQVGYGNSIYGVSNTYAGYGNRNAGAAA